MDNRKATITIKRVLAQKAAPLTNKGGPRRSMALHGELKNLGINTRIKPVASSIMKRAYETAAYAGFRQISKYPSLNGTGDDLPARTLDSMIKRKKAPPPAIATARKLLTSPLAEKVRITHGQLIAVIAYVLCVPSSQLFIPR